MAEARAVSIRRRGLMLVLSSPSGAGKSSISRGLLAVDQGIRMSVSVTTRPPRASETEGLHYHFVDDAGFARMIEQGELLEHARVYHHRYGTPRRAVEDALAAGLDMLFDIDWQGAQQLRERKSDDVVGVFILPPTVAELARRLRTRAEDDDATVRYRLTQVANDVTHWAEYDYVIVNEDLARSVRAVKSILDAERLKRRRQPGLAAFVEQFRQPSVSRDR